jgi:hypothetical protein
MAYFITNIGRNAWQECTCCHHRLKLLDNWQSLAIFLGARDTRRRAFQCMNCGRVLCKDCRHSGFSCFCGSNAWVAVPYLKESMARADEYLIG